MLGGTYNCTVTRQQMDMIAVDPNVVHGQARIRGTRIAVSVVLDCLAVGMTDDEILAQYPMLTVEGIRAAAAYEATLSSE